MCLPSAGIPEQLREQLHILHGGGLLAATRAFQHLRERRGSWHRQPCGFGPALREIAAEPLAPRAQVAHLRRILRGAVEPQARHVLVRKRQREAVAERFQRLVVELLLLVRAHLALAPGAHAVALLGLGEDHRGLALVVHGGVIGGIDLDRVVAAAFQAVDVVVGELRHQRLQLRVLVEEVLAVEAAVGGGVGLELAVHRLVQAPQDHALAVAREERIPVAAPDQLDHVPARAGEQTLQLLDDRAVAAHRAVQALQVAVDDEDQVVEALARGDRQPGERLGLVHLAVARERPHLAARGGEDAAALEIAHEARLVDGVQGSQAHGAGRELPELRHQPGMRVRGQPLAAGLAAIAVELRVGEPPLEEGARVHTRRRVRLEIHQVGTALRRVAAEEVVEAHLEQVGGGSEARDVTAELGVRAVGAHHHGERVPADDRGEPLLDGEVAREWRLLMRRDGVAVRRVEPRARLHIERAGEFRQPRHHVAGALLARARDQGVERVEPLPRLGRIGVKGLSCDELADVGHVRHVANPV